jgi:cytochrome P450
MTAAAHPQAITMGLLHQWLLFSRTRVHVDALRQRHGPLVIFREKTGTYYLLLTAEGARQVFAADPAGYDAFWREGFTGLAGAGSLWVLGGDAHRRERQLLAPPFHPRGFREYGQAIRAVTRQHLEAWRPGENRRAMDTTLTISLDIILRLVFGVDQAPSVENGRNVLKRVLHTVHPLIVFFPWLQRPWFPIWRRHARARADYSAWVNAYLAERRAQGGAAGDVVGRLLNARYDDGSPMTDAAIHDELFTILVSAQETTATALAWALYELGSHPAVLAQLRAELALLGPDPDPDAVVKLPYLTAVCNETLRLHTLLAEIARVIVNPLLLFGNLVPPGASVMVSIMSIHHDPALYPEPDRFRPERFNERTYGPHEFLPFGGGHRRCLGAGLADYEMRIALAEIVTRWDFAPAGPEVEIRHDIAMGPKRGVPLHLTARRAGNG